MCWERYNSIETTEDLIKSYNIGIGNLNKMKNGIYEESNEWFVSANKYMNKFKDIHDDCSKCKGGIYEIIL